MFIPWYFPPLSQTVCLCFFSFFPIEIRYSVKAGWSTLPVCNPTSAHNCLKFLPFEAPLNRIISSAVSASGESNTWAAINTPGELHFQISYTELNLKKQQIEVCPDEKLEGRGVLWREMPKVCMPRLSGACGRRACGSNPTQPLSVPHNPPVL